MMFAEAIYDRLPTRTGKDQWDWYFSDRPPLQAGFALLFSPLWSLFGRPIAYRRCDRAADRESHRAMGARAFARFSCARFVSRGRRRRHLGLCLLSLDLSVAEAARRDVRPRRDGAAAARLLPQGAAHACCGVHRGRRDGARDADAQRRDLHAVAVGADAGVARRRDRELARRRLAVAIMAALYAPWLAYARFVDPNNDKLLKLHLTDGSVD